MDRSTTLWAFAAVATLLASILASLSLGPYRSASLSHVLEWLRGSHLNPVENAILYARLRRTLAGIVVGASLAFSGANLQYMFRNPLADPYVFGIASGAALGVSIALYRGHASPSELYVYSLGGALASLILVMAGGLAGGATPFSYIVVGVSLGYLLWSASLMILYLIGPRSHIGLIWLFGTLAYTNATQLKLATATYIIAHSASLIFRSRYSRLMLGPDVSSIHGTPYRKATTELIALSGVVTAATTAISGPVGFVGIVAPWFARITAGSLYGRFTIVASIWGASLVVLADTAGRAVGGGVELPLTAMLSLVGVPVILWIIYRSRGMRPW